MTNAILNIVAWLQSERGQVGNVPQWVWFLVVLVAIFAVVVLVGGTCTIGDRSITAG